ncbi:MAG: HD domain-containing protein [Bacteroidales bacterium]|nr:HD domain-containing protein [Bacteroidales bacterium]MBR4215381.1 HD domain-containing protein [Bacteroidales bacterium]
MTNLRHKLTNPVFEQIAQVANSNNLETYVIGGYVRDLILGIPSKDIDFVVAGSGIDLAKKVADYLHCKNVQYFKNFGTAMVRYRGEELEFVGARKESYDRNSRKPIVENGTIHDDQLRRDFTINALAISLNQSNFGELTDPFNGLDDLQRGIIRTPLDPDITFSDDPLRMLRAIRFACRLGFTICKETEDAIARNAKRMEIVSKERIVDELNKIMATAKPSRGFMILMQTGLLDLILPQLVKLKGVEIKEGKGHKDNFLHTLQVLDNVAAMSDNVWLRWAALFHDIAKPNVKRFVNGTWTFHSHEFLGAKMIPQIFKQMKLPLNDKMKYVQKLVGMHHRAIPISNDEITDSAVRRLIYDAGDDLDDLLILCRADITSKIEEKRNRFLNNYKIVSQKIEELEKKDFRRNWQPPIDGNYIMRTFEMQPSRNVGVIKDCIKDSILDGKIDNTFEAAYNLMIEKGLELGLTAVHPHLDPNTL